MTHFVEVNGKKYNLISKLSIPQWLTDYLFYDSVVYSNGVFTEVPATDICFLCDRNFSEGTAEGTHLCPDVRINRELGYVGRCCIDCLWYLRRNEGAVTIPAPIKKTLDRGYKPKNVDYYLS